MSDLPVESSYDRAGVKYDVLDRFKRTCQNVARSTAAFLKEEDIVEPEGARGESAYVIETKDSFIAHVEEGLGTKNLVADNMLELTGRSFYRQIGIDTVAAIVNDLITCGATPLVFALHAAVGNVSWFSRPNPEITFRAEIEVASLGAVGLVVGPELVPDAEISSDTPEP